ncbi:MAG: hypothetical protein M1836_007222 [Candelina mexicana]|nr:MAG: hypothetical protein M1836_007222 [Candelina mexicana]
MDNIALSYPPRGLQHLINRAIVVSRWAELDHRCFCTINDMQDNFLRSPSHTQEELMARYYMVWRYAWSCADYSQACLEVYIERINAQLTETPFGGQVNDLGYADFVDGVRWARARLGIYRKPDVAWRMVSIG